MRELPEQVWLIEMVFPAVAAKEPKVNLYWSFRSPYSYIVLPRILALTAEARGVTIEVRVVHPAAIRNPAYFARDGPAGAALLPDGQRPGRCFPRHAVTAPDPRPNRPGSADAGDCAPISLSRAVSAVSALPLRSVAEGWTFCTEVAKLLWDGSVSGWNEGSHLANAAARAGLDLAELENGDRTATRPGYEEPVSR